MGSAPDVVDVRRDDLAGLPGAERPRRISGVQIPSGQRRLDCELIAPEDLHVDVRVRAPHPSDKEIDGPSAGNSGFQTPCSSAIG